MMEKFFLPQSFVQWKMAGHLKGNDPIGDMPVFTAIQVQTLPLEGAIILRV